MTNKKKPFFLIFVLVAFSINLRGQERVNRSKITFNKQSDIMSTAIGWAYNDELGEWVDYKNVISSDKVYKEKYPTLVGSSYMMSRERQNFTSIQFKTITFNSKNHFVLLINKWRGRYQYPNIEEDWYEWKETEGYIFDEKEYAKLFSDDSLNILVSKNNVSVGNRYEVYDEAKFLDLIQTELITPQTNFLYSFPFKKGKDKENNFVRFFVPEVYVEGALINFDKKYFEVIESEFEKLKIK